MLIGARNGGDRLIEVSRRSFLPLIRPLLKAMERDGFAEYFDPLTGAGLGGGQFSWTAAAWLVLSQQIEASAAP